MKIALWTALAAIFAALLLAQTGAQQSQPPAPAQPQVQAQPPAQAQPQGQPMFYGRGRGGAPWAWNDTNKDGICDLTGQPVGQGRPVGFGLGRGPCGRGMARGFGGRGRGFAGWGRGFAGWGRGWWRGQAYPPAQAPVQPPAPAQP